MTDENKTVDEVMEEARDGTAVFFDSPKKKTKCEVFRTAPTDMGTIVNAWLNDHPTMEYIDSCMDMEAGVSILVLWYYDIEEI